VEVDSKIAADFARRPIGSVTAGVVVDKQLIWSKSYGNADMEKKISADADTVYRIGSITKMFTALMLEQLVDAGKVHLSDPVEKYFPEIRAVQGRFSDAPPITLIQLATHTSGLGREPDNVETYVTGAVADWEKTLIAALTHLRYQFAPGTRFFYSNIGYAILGAALARAAGELYLDYVPKHTFQPLGMTNSALDRNAQMLPHLAKGYQLLGPGGAVDSETPQREHETGRGYKVPNGAIYTTVGDLARFASFLMEQGPETVLKTASLDRFQRLFAVPADIGLTSRYGIGFHVDRRNNYVAFRRRSNPGVATNIWMKPLGQFPESSLDNQHRHCAVFVICEPTSFDLGLDCLDCFLLGLQQPIQILIRNLTNRAPAILSELENHATSVGHGTPSSLAPCSVSGLPSLTCWIGGFLATYSFMNALRSMAC
jgi:CubicO group peptidase (beta-lactamase class C family)